MLVHHISATISGCALKSRTITLNTTAKRLLDRGGRAYAPVSQVLVQVEPLLAFSDVQPHADARVGVKRSNGLDIIV